MKILEQLNGDWKEYKNCMISDYMYSHSYSLKVYSGDKQLYTIHCDLYDFTKLRNAPKCLTDDLQATYHVQFKNKNGKTFNVECGGSNVSEVVNFYADIYEKMQCIAYDD